MKVSDEMACAICGSAQLRRLSAHSDRRRGLSGCWSTFECEACGVIALLPTPSASQLNEYYARYSIGDTIDFRPSRWARFPFLRSQFHRLTGDVDPRDFIKPAKDARILDYGCGQAGAVIDFHARGFAISGAEMSTTVVSACQDHGLDVRAVISPDEIPFGDDQFDIVYLMQVFEHFRAPHQLMKELARVTKEGGQLYLSVPNSRSIWRRVFGADWVSGWFAPFHLFHYEEESLSGLAKLHGFEMLESWSRTPISWFQLNLKATLHRRENHLDSYCSVVDSAPVRYFLIAVVRLIEIFAAERDCLVIKFVKSAKPE